MTTLVRSAADILADVLADPDAPPITTEDWRVWVPQHGNGHGPTVATCAGCLRHTVIRAKSLCQTCYRRDRYERKRAQQ